MNSQRFREHFMMHTVFGIVSLNQWLKDRFTRIWTRRGGGVKKGGRREGRLERGGRGKGGGVPEELTEDSENDF